MCCCCCCGRLCSTPGATPISPNTRRFRRSDVVHGRPSSLHARHVSAALARRHLHRFFLHQSQLVSVRCRFSGGTRRRIRRRSAADGMSMSVGRAAAAGADADVETDEADGVEVDEVDTAETPETDAA